MTDRLSPKLMAALVAGALVGCGGKASLTGEQGAGGSQASGGFRFDCVAYDVGCPLVATIDDESQEGMPPAIAVGSTFFVSFVGTEEGAYPPFSIFPAASGSLSVVEPPHLLTPFPGVLAALLATAPGDAELDVTGADGTIEARTTVHLVSPTTLLFSNPDGSPLVQPVPMVPMGQGCIYVSPATGSGELLAGVPACTAHASNATVAIADQGGQVVCIDGVTYGDSVVTVTCGPATAAFSVIAQFPMQSDEDASVPPVITDAGNADTGDADAQAHPCVTSCGDAACVDPSTDPANCGDCGQVCDGTCQTGRCIATLAVATNPYAVVTNGTDVYWTDDADGGAASGAVMMVSTHGGAPVVLASGLNAPRFLALDENNVYWTSGSEVMSVGLTGGTPVVLAIGQGYPVGIAVDSSNVYWTNEGSGEVMDRALDGGVLATLVSVGPGYNPTQLVISDKAAYWMQLADYVITSVPLTGGSATQFYYGENYYIAGIGIDGANVYYTEESALGPVMECPLDGGTATTLVTNNGTQGVVSDGLNVYYTSPNGNPPVYNGAVLRVPVAGGTATMLASGGMPQSIAVDGTSVYWTSPTNGTVMRVTPK